MVGSVRLKEGGILSSDSVLLSEGVTLQVWWDAGSSQAKRGILMWWVIEATNNGIQRTMTDMTRGRWIQMMDKYIVGRKKKWGGVISISMPRNTLRRRLVGDLVKRYDGFMTKNVDFTQSTSGQLGGSHDQFDTAFRVPACPELRGSRDRTHHVPDLIKSSAPHGDNKNHYQYDFWVKSTSFNLAIGSDWTLKSEECLSTHRTV